jgi:hypothetical protein
MGKKENIRVVTYSSFVYFFKKFTAESEKLTYRFYVLTIDLHIFYIFINNEKKRQKKLKSNTPFF